MSLSKNFGAWEIDDVVLAMYDRLKSQNHDVGDDHNNNDCGYY